MRVLPFETKGVVILTILAPTEKFHFPQTKTNNQFSPAVLRILQQLVPAPMPRGHGHLRGGFGMRSSWGELTVLLSPEYLVWDYPVQELGVCNWLNNEKRYYMSESHYTCDLLPGIWLNMLHKTVSLSLKLSRAWLLHYLQANKSACYNCGGHTPTHSKKPWGL